MRRCFAVETVANTGIFELKKIFLKSIDMRGIE